MMVKRDYSLLPSSQELKCKVTLFCETSINLWAEGTPGF